jgi:putative transposase
VDHLPTTDLVTREFVATNINQFWVADMTDRPTWAGFLYLSVVTDVYSREIVGWGFGKQMTSERANIYQPTFERIWSVFVG